MTLGSFCVDHTAPGSSVDPGPYRFLFDDLPAGVPALCSVVQGLLIHALETKRYGVQLAPERLAEVEVGTVSGMLAGVLRLDPGPLQFARPPERRWVATCHDYALLLCAMLRHRGLKARVRSGFAAYLQSERFTDHWLCEMWVPQQHRWVQVDAQLDTVHCQSYGIRFEPCDVPADQYLTGAQAWSACRRNQLNPTLFGFRMWLGWGYLRHVLLRDAFALAQIAPLAWAPLGLPEKAEDQLQAEDMAMLDLLAALVMEDPGIDAMQQRCQGMLATGHPPDWRPWTLNDVRHLGMT